MRINIIPDMGAAREMQAVEELISKQYSGWKSEIINLDNSESEFQKWLFIHIASVLFGGKAGELLTISEPESRLETGEMIEVIENLSGEWGFNFHLLRRDPGSAKVVIYNNSKVKSALSKVPPCIIYDKLNYTVNTTPAAFLQEIGRRWQSTGEIPHEVGLALGYPVKDVLGYMGLMPLECMGICGWRIYGDPEPSLNKCKKFTHARQCAMIFLAA